MVIQRITNSYHHLNPSSQNFLSRISGYCLQLTTLLSGRRNSFTEGGVLCSKLRGGEHVAGLLAGGDGPRVSDLDSLAVGTGDAASYDRRHLISYFYVRVSVLAVEFGPAVSVLYGELGAMMQAAETQRAFLFYPDRLIIIDFNRLHRAFPCT